MPTSISGPPPASFLSTRQARAEDKAESAVHLREWSKILLACVAHQLAVIWIEVQAIADREFHLSGFAGCDHAVAIGN